jgi:hypothetical protein
VLSIGVVLVERPVSHEDCLISQELIGLFHWHSFGTGRVHSAGISKDEEKVSQLNVSAVRLDPSDSLLVSLELFEG